MVRLNCPHSPLTLLPMLQVQRVGLGEICRQEEARAQDVAPAQLGTYGMPGAMTPSVPGSHSLKPYFILFFLKYSCRQKLFSPEIHWPKQITDHSDQRSQKC